MLAVGRQKDPTGSHSRRTEKNIIFSVLLGLVLYSYSSSTMTLGGISAKSSEQPVLNQNINDTLLDFSLTTQYQNTHILRDGCSITVVLLDPDVGMGALWALESVAEYIRPAETACFLIQTSVCRESDEDDKTNNSTTINSTVVQYANRAKRMEEEAHPFFRHMIHQGNVRMTVFHHTFYQLECSNFKSVNNAWQNWHYWGPKEFLQEDSDLVLVIQSDAVLCRPLDARLWQDVSFVGAPWPTGDFCRSVPGRWKAYHKAKQGPQTLTPIPPFPSSHDQLCQDGMVGFHGNGGLSLRQRSWLRRVIEYCPNNMAGINSTAAPCYLTEALNEDSYFSIILRGLNAPLPSVYEAALFSLEHVTMSKFREDYGPVNETWKEERVSRRWVPDHYHEFMDNYRHNNGSNVNTNIFVPIGIHQPWTGLPADEICHPQIHRECKYLRHVILNSNGAMVALAERVANGVEPCFDLNSSSTSNKTNYR